MRKIISISFLIFLVIGCSENINSDSVIAKKIEKVCNNKMSCRIDMKNLVNVEWDKMYFFKEGMSLEQINQILGFKYNYFEDIAKRLVFVKANQVVFHEDEFPSIESAKNGELVFNIGDSIMFKSYLPDEAIFSVQKVEFSMGSYYELTPIK
jgi:hypothetical protein